MKILLDVVVLLVGFFALIKGADYFVDGSAAVARRMKVPGVVIGLTIVAMGTSAPELAVSLSAALSGSNAIAVSNVVGSNIFNLLAVLGVCALLKPLPVDTGIRKKDFPVCLAATLLVGILAGNGIFSGVCKDFHNMDAEAGVLYRWNGLLLAAIFIGYMVYTVCTAKKSAGNEEEDAGELQPVWKSVLFIVLGLAAIILGGQMVVNSARSLALAFGMSETLVGLTIVAIGTSLPELVTSVAASRKGENGMAIGNVVGSNVFNLLLILGASSSIHPISISVASFFDIGILLGVSLIAYAFVCTSSKVNRVEGGVLVGMYIAYTVFAILR